jgi:ABC-2 type transport system permease protein
MKYVLSAFPAQWRQAVATMLQYRGEIALWAIWGVIYPAVALTMWSAAAAGAGDTAGRIDAGAAGDVGPVAAGDSGSTPSIKGYSAADFAAYFLLTMIVGHVCAAWDVFEFGWLVRSGNLSPMLLKPLLPLWSSLANNYAYKAVTLVILVPLWLLVAWIVQPALKTTWPQAALGVLALLLAAGLNYLWGYTLALIAFWTTRTDAIGELWFGASLLLGGRMAPLALLPAPLQWAAAVLPFKWAFWFPTEALIGRLQPMEIAAGLAAQAGWLAVGVLVFRVMWRESLRRYTAVGA